MINATTEAQIRARFIEMGIQCNQEIPLTVDEMRTLHEHKLPPGESPKCLLACVYRKANWLDDQGMFVSDSVRAIIETDYKDEPEKQNNVKQLFEQCSKVNEEKVSDGTKGCDRSALLFECLTQNAPKGRTVSQGGPGLLLLKGPPIFSHIVYF
ncbi:hypothetical protein EVAR_26470_1 [Eumeta japonica]|uniref:Uncharacterized protein n=1 Tax=Eumeta variegata TaxID=151549 RepID=A0A4C1V7P3_EUMVA|nr:hypothetical protein EVAR_26470_1 [Eumeta japonica]